MKTPPLLLGFTLLFWGWQTDLVIPAAIMAAVLEGWRFVKIRWDLSDDEFKRIWTFCALLFLAAAVYAFADNGGPSGFGRVFQGISLSSEQEAGTASARTAAAFIRWLPMVFILFVAAQAYSVRQEIPLHTISLILQWRWKQAKKHGQPLPAVRGVDVSYPYFALCLFAASAHPNRNDTFFWGLCVLLAWALWLHRPRRFAPVMWVGALALAVLFGYSGARAIALVQRYTETLNIQWPANWFARNRTDPAGSRTQIGKIGRIKTSMKIVARLKPESGGPPAYLREASYRSYYSSVWRAGQWKNGFVFVPRSVTNENIFVLQRDKPGLSKISIACFLDGYGTNGPQGLLPLPSGVARLEDLPVYCTVQTNSAGSVLAEGPGLVQFNAFYGPGQTIDGPPETNETVSLDQTNYDPFFLHEGHMTGAVDLEVPTNEVPALKQVVSELNLKGQNHVQALQTISRFFATKFTYRPWQDAETGPKSQTALSRFLLKTRAGHCEYFATATVLLLREIGIPARYAVGYSVHEASWSGYVVRQRDAHAWCLVWNDQKKIWEDFDTTPGSWLEVESEHGMSSAWLADAWWWVHFHFAEFRWGQTHLRDYILIGLVPVLLLLLIQIVRQQRRRKIKDVKASTAIAWPGLDSEFYQIEKQLALRGLLRGANETLGAWLQRAATDPSLTELNQPLQAILRLHYRYRFDPLGLGDADREELRRQARLCLDELLRREKVSA